MHGHTRKGKPNSGEHNDRIAAALVGRLKTDGITYRSGRKLIFVGRSHPMSVGGYVSEHRLVMAQSVGRMLTSDEHVHHIDLDRSNNEIANLVLVTNRQHGLIHREIVRGVDPATAVLEVLR